MPSLRNSRKTLSAASLAVSAIAFGTPARAQLLNQFLPSEVYGTGTEPDVTVTSRIRSDYDNGGIHAGSFTIRPRLNESFGYESNVLGSRPSRGSTLLETNALIDATSDSSRGAINTGLGVDDYRYFDLPGQSYTNWNARVGGTYALGRDSASVLVSHENLTQTQRDLDVPQLTSPLAYEIDTFRAGYKANFNRLSLMPSVEVAHYSYNSGLAGGAIYDQSYRNRVLVTPAIAAAYEFATRRSVVVVVRNATAFYSQGTAVSPKRNFNDTSILGGIDYDLNGILRARALVGYETRSFSSNAYATISAPVAELTLIYNPTNLTTITSTLARRIQDSSDETTAGVTSLSASLRVDHELRRNILLAATGGIVRNDYVAGGRQTLYTGGLSGTYLLNRYAAVSTMYNITSRTSTNTTTLNLNGFAAGSDFVDHRILLQLKLSL